jgi:hypothetical protein
LQKSRTTKEESSEGQKGHGLVNKSYTNLFCIGKISPDSIGNLAPSVLLKEVQRKNQDTLFELFPII